ncbi:bifunctional Tetratricopeptide-like helical domain superfamily/HAT (Half-A-TPR) repeat/Tetratricopeptide repeat/Pre-mRNA-splicing factor Syf1-like [Babesia duncani]|uniref:Pre-mRNA-splicing factor SYF1 n=1 Tax=Babesia duncani TaxID=323732 RepID=A0AAD9PLI3_9APIC|nr:bifunctional Tetratricopeptide-like helical domain superfamily/HAT (Half-A-TPR) repeat/Tetratricopeptide repeat/Pre-mRNA-splicing factor Syf1-like [Babesia duncani]
MAATRYNYYQASDSMEVDEIVKSANFSNDSDGNADLATLYDRRFYEEIVRDPYKSKPWTEHIKLLKSIRPTRPTRRRYKVENITQLVELEESDAPNDISDVDAYVAINEMIFKAYSKAVEYIPLSYKIWYQYLRDSIEELSTDYYGDPDLYEQINARFDQSLVCMYGYPAVYLLYGSFLQLQPHVTGVRRLYDKALLNLAITQHHLVWEEYLKFVNRVDLLPLGKAVYRRYIQLKPTYREHFYEFLKRHGDYDGACTVLCGLLNDDAFVSEENKTQFDLWLELCEMIRDHPQDITTLPIQDIIREGISKYTDQIASLWTILAEVYIMKGKMIMARDVYEEALKSVTSVQDFGNIFDIYANFLESYAREMAKSDSDSVQVELAIDRLEHLVLNRAMLLVNVKLKQNKHNIYNWISHIDLVQDNPQEVVEIYNKALESIDVRRCVGRITDLWIRFANFHLDAKNVKGAEEIYKRATKSNFKFVDDLATIWCSWVEMYLVLGDYQKALEIARRSLDVSNDPDANEVEKRLYKSVKLWYLCLDMEQNFGTVATCKATFNKMVDAKVVTPQVCLGFVSYLENLGYFEASFNAFERCVALFKWPQAYYLYLPYLTRFIDRYQGTRLERAREIFDQCIYSGPDKSCAVPSKYAKQLLYLYAHMEEEFGSIRRCVGILQDATKNTEPEEQLQMITLYIAKVAEYYGIVHTRGIYNECLERTSDVVARDLCSMYIQMERGLGEIDRARAIYCYCSQMCDPAKYPNFWNEWREFEVLHGNEDCFREMLRIKRTVQAQYSNVHFNTEEIT